MSKGSKEKRKKPKPLTDQEIGRLWEFGQMSEGYDERILVGDRATQLWEEWKAGELDRDQLDVMFETFLWLQRQEVTRWYKQRGPVRWGRRSPSAQLGDDEAASVASGCSCGSLD